MKFIEILFETDILTKEELDALLDRSSSDEPEDLDDSLGDLVDILVSEIQNKVKKGEIDKDTLGSFKKLNNVLDSILGKAKKEQLQQPSKDQPEKKQEPISRLGHRSWYDVQQRRGEELTDYEKRARLVKKWGERLGKLAINNPGSRRSIMHHLNIALKYAKKGGRMNEEYEIGGPENILDELSKFLKTCSVKEIKQINNIIRQAIQSPESFITKKPSKLGPSRTGIARTLGRQKMTGQGKAERWSREQQRPGGIHPIGFR